MNFADMVHIGHKIKEVAQKARVPAQELASKINRSRTVVYDIFERKSIDSALLSKISLILEHDFFQHYYSQNEELNTFREHHSSYAKKDNLIVSLTEEVSKLKKELSEAREKNKLLQKINLLLEKKK